MLYINEMRPQQTTFKIVNDVYIHQISSSDFVIDGNTMKLRNSAQTYEIPPPDPDGTLTGTSPSGSGRRLGSLGSPTNHTPSAFDTAAYNQETLESLPPSVPAPASPVQTEQYHFEFQSVSTSWTNQALTKLTFINIEDTADPMGPIVHAKIDGFVRVVDANMNGGFGIVVLMSSFGRFIVNGSVVSPASGVWATMPVDQMYGTSLSNEVVKVLQGYAIINQRFSLRRVI